MKITPLEALGDKEGWKMSMFKGMYVVRILVLIQGIWLKESRLTYVEKKLMILVVFVKIRMQINWAGVMFNNLHSKLRDLGGPNKYNMIRDVKFGGAQILDIVLWKWFPMDPSLRLPISKEEEELGENFVSRGEEEFTTKNRHVITRCTCRYG